jgi:hypothetical protein
VRVDGARRLAAAAAPTLHSCHRGLGACLLRLGTSWVVVHQLCSGALGQPEPVTENSRASFGVAGVQATQVVALKKRALAGPLHSHDLPGMDTEPHDAL